MRRPFCRVVLQRFLKFVHRFPVLFILSVLPGALEMNLGRIRWRRFGLEGGWQFEFAHNPLNTRHKGCDETGRKPAKGIISFPRLEISE